MKLPSPEQRKHVMEVVHPLDSESVTLRPCPPWCTDGRHFADDEVIYADDGYHHYGAVIEVPTSYEFLGMPGDPETIVRCKNDAIYELAANAFFCDLFAHRFGAVGICGGYGRFLPGASLPCHTHDYDESITIVKGAADCLVEGKKYQLAGCDTAFIPSGLPHRFLNNSNEEMAMVWVYAGNEPDRKVVDAGYCSGALAWPLAIVSRG